MDESGDRTAPIAAGRVENRLPYEKPAVAWEQPLEVQPSLMSGCAKQSAQDSVCNSTFPLGS
jgi:hypothetical protein